MTHINAFSSVNCPEGGDLSTSRTNPLLIGTTSLRLSMSAIMSNLRWMPLAMPSHFQTCQKIGFLDPSASSGIGFAENLGRIAFVSIMKPRTHLPKYLRRRESHQIESFRSRESLAISHAERERAASTANDATVPILEAINDNETSISSNIQGGDNYTEDGDSSDDKSESDTTKYRLRSGR
jgi:hypothetical protein